jgi:hypothetical protein
MKLMVVNIMHTTQAKVKQNPSGDKKMANHAAGASLQGISEMRYAWSEYPHIVVDKKSAEFRLIYHPTSEV